MKLIKLILLLTLPVLSFSQTIKIGDGLTVVHFNAGWNSANDVKWVSDLENCKIKTCDIATDTKAQNKYEIVVVPTIIIFNEGEEVKRYQADISFTMKAELEDVQEKINEIYGDDF